MQALLEGHLWTQQMSPFDDSPPCPSLEIKFSRIGVDDVLWLVAGTTLDVNGMAIRLRGRIPAATLGREDNWALIPEAKRTDIENNALLKHGSALKSALVTAAQAVTDFLTTCQAEALDPNMRKLQPQWFSGKQDLLDLPRALTQTLGSLRTANRQRDLARQIALSVKLYEYPDTFAAHTKARKLIAVLGPTNSGKTYEAFERLAHAKSGFYLGPLRLLALEAYSRLNTEFGVTASLVTGEERRIIPGSCVTASTIEMLDVARPVEVAVIDEVQMLSDPDRGWAWTQAIVGANADEVWLLGAPSAEPALRALASRLGLPLEVRYKQRKLPLEVSDSALGAHPAQALTNAKTGDAFIVFSRRDALNLRDDLLAQKKTVACIYGALSPEVREKEAQRFADGSAEVLVATDAIGLGLNLPIQRIIFTTVAKFNGEERQPLPIPLLQQIGGRAGRFGHQEEAGQVLGLTPIEHAFVSEGMRVKQASLADKGFQIAPTAAYLTSLAELTKDQRLEVLLSLFMTHADRGDRFFLPFVPDEQFERSGKLDALPLSLELKHIFSMAPMSAQVDTLDRAWWDWAKKVAAGQPVILDLLKKDPTQAKLEDAENTVRLLAGYRWFAHRLPDLFPDQVGAEQALPAWTDAIDAHLASSRKQGAGGGRKGLPSWYWNTPVSHGQPHSVHHTSRGRESHPLPIRRRAA